MTDQEIVNSWIENTPYIKNKEAFEETASLFLKETMPFSLEEMVKQAEMLPFGMITTFRLLHLCYAQKRMSLKEVISTLYLLAENRPYILVTIGLWYTLDRILNESTSDDQKPTNLC